MKKNLLGMILIAVFMLIVSFPIFAFAADSNKTATLIQSAEDYINKGDLVSAEKNVKKALEIAKDDPWALRVLARIHREQFEKMKEMQYLELAEVEIEKALRSLPNDAHVLTEAAQVHACRNNKTKAIEAIESALRIDPERDYFKNVKEKIQSMP